MKTGGSNLVGFIAGEDESFGGRGGRGRGERGDRGAQNPRSNKKALENYSNKDFPSLG